MRYMSGPRSAPKKHDPVSVAGARVRHRCSTEFYPKACRKAAVARSWASLKKQEALVRAALVELIALGLEVERRASRGPR